MNDKFSTFLNKDSYTQPIKTKINEQDSDDIENLSKKLKIDHDKIKSIQEDDSNKASNSPLPSFQILVNSKIFKKNEKYYLNYK